MSSWTVDDWDIIPEAARGKKLKLLTSEELKALPEGTEVWSVMGDRHVLGEGEFPEPDPDTRGGFTAWGTEVS